MAIPLLALLVFGCASLELSKQMKKFDLTSENYATAIKWSDFEAAYYSSKDAQIESKPPDLSKLKLVKVTSYEVRQFIVSEDKSQVRQIVEINYYKLNYNVVRTILDHQLWEYDPEGKIWYLRSELPDFK
ncbi:hypothetical protein ACFL03_13535 [Thermodesulfobacteriota bacterium]